MSLTRFGIAYRVARDLPEGSYVNLGVGIPSLVANFLPQDKNIFLHSENGILGFGPPVPGEENPYVFNASRGSVSMRPGASLFDHALSFTMIRGGHLTHAVMGAIQVAANGDLANWLVPGQKTPAVGGAMDLAANTRNVYIAMTHVTNDGEPKIVPKCTAPLTAAKCVRRIYTDLAVINVTEDGLELTEVAPGLVPADVQAKTGALLSIADNWREMDIPEKIQDIPLLS
jgi:3-oxoacid CoA-transferase subunit B